MNLALTIAVGIGGLAAAGWAIWLLVRGPRVLALPIAYLGLVAFTWLAADGRTEGYRLPAAPDRNASTRPATGPVEDFVTSDTCRSCHPGEYHSWHASYHRTMTQVATEESVKGDFDSGFVAEFPGLNVRFSRDEGDFWATYSIPDPTTGGFTSVRKRRIVMTTGSHHYQVYWTGEPWVTPEKSNDRSVWLVPYVYLFDEQRWIPRHASFLNPPDDTPEFHRWNESCVRCHSTHGISKPDPVRDILDTRTVELGISCEACHGPGKAHIEANRNPLRRYNLHRENEGDPTIVNPARLDHERSSETCGQCHSITIPPDEETHERWKSEGKDYRAGQDLDDTALVMHPGRGDTREHEKLFPDFFKRRFWSDGMVRVAGREYHGLLSTPCFQRGEMSCISCHGMHKQDGDPRSDLDWANDQLAPGMRGNAACTQCHESLANAAALENHSRHPAASSGSSCYNCHMPHTTYGLHKGIRSHQIDSPSIQVTLETGRPNGCNLCHLDKTLEWTAENLNEWYAQPIPHLTPDQQSVAASLLWLLKGDAGQRALVASGFDWDEARKVSGSEWMPPFLAQLQLDPYHAVQIIANKSLRTIEGYENIPRYPEMKEATAEVSRIWQQRNEALQIVPELLMSPDGKIRREEFRRLLRMRDDTPVYLNE